MNDCTEIVVDLSALQKQLKKELIKATLEAAYFTHAHEKFCQTLEYFHTKNPTKKDRTQEEQDADYERYSAFLEAEYSKFARRAAKEISIKFECEI